MRVSTVSRLQAAMLVGLALLFASVLAWGIWQIRSSDQQLAAFSRLSAQIGSELPQQVNRYLSSGDALAHSAAVQLLQQLDSQVLTEADADAGHAFEMARQQLGDNLANRYLGLGKLSGDPQGLLINAEREIAAQLSLAIGYGLDAQVAGKGDGRRYVELAAAALEEIQTLALARARFFAQGDEASDKAYAAAFQQLQSDAGKLTALPLLGLLEAAEPVDPYALRKPKPPADKAKGLQQELNSLIRRYPTEQQRTSALIRERSATSADLKQEVATLGQQIDGLAGALLAQRQQTMAQVELALAVMVVAMVLLAVVSALVTGRHVLRPLRNLRDAFRQLVDSGQYHALSGVDARSELGEIAGFFNALLAQLEDQNRARSEQLAVVSSAMLGQLEGAATSLKVQISSIHDAASGQEQTAASLQQTLSQVRGQAQRSAEAAQAAHDLVQQQAQQLQAFAGAMAEVEQQANSTRSHSAAISQAMRDQSRDIGRVLGLS